MIPRYSREEIAEVWSDRSKYEIWLEIELHACDAMAKLGIIPAQAAALIRQRAKFDADEIARIEKTVKHDVIAFLTNVARYVNSPDSRYLHQGMTSSDVLDTGFAVQLKKATDILLNDLNELLAALKSRAEEFRGRACIGRTHGIHAEPTTFGLKLAQAYAEFERGRDRLQRAKEEIATCAISGAVGTYAYLRPEVEEYVADKLGLQPETISTQVIPRDRHAMYFATLGVIASSIERLAIEIRHLQRTEVHEVEEPFTEGQKGSSAMPHKRNPILAENLTGLARMVRSSVIPAMENVALWHERDISHSSVERMIGPDATVTLDFALVRLTKLIRDLRVFDERMDRNLALLDGLNFSQDVLLALTEAGAERERAYELVQRNAMAVWEERQKKGEAGQKSDPNRLKNQLASDADVMRLITKARLDELFGLARHLKHEELIFRRVFGEAPAASAKTLTVSASTKGRVSGGNGPTGPASMAASPSRSRD